MFEPPQVLEDDSPDIVRNEPPQYIVEARDEDIMLECMRIANGINGVTYDTLDEFLEAAELLHRIVKEQDWSASKPDKSVT